MKQITLFGATGRTGRYVLQFALDEGYAVKAFVRDAEKLGMLHTNLKVIEGDVKDAAAVSEAVSGSWAVVSTLAPTPGENPAIMAIGAQNIVAAMEARGISRIIFAAGAGIPSPDDKPSLLNTLMVLLIKTMAKKVYEDARRSVETISKSGLAWTIVRGPSLKDAPRNGSYRVGYVGKGMGRTLTRGNFADFIVKQIEDKEYLHKMPALSDK